MTPPLGRDVIAARADGRHVAGGPLAAACSKRVWGGWGFKEKGGIWRQTGDVANGGNDVTVHRSMCHDVIDDINDEIQRKQTVGRRLLQPEPILVQATPEKRTV